MSSPVTPDNDQSTADFIPYGLLIDRSNVTDVTPLAPLDDPVESGLLEEKALVDDAANLLPGPLPYWTKVTVGEAVTRLNWIRIYPRLETVEEGAVVMVPTLLSGWVKIIKGPTPTTSTFYILGDTLLAESGSIKEQYDNIVLNSAPDDPLERVHLVLDVIGLAPILGGPADVANTVLYFLEGDTFNASLSMLAIIPLAGEATTASKWSVKYGEALVLFGGDRNLLGKTMGLSEGLNAHHIIPWELRYHELVQAAGRAGFDLNDVINGYTLTHLKKRDTQVVELVMDAGKVAMEKETTIFMRSGVHANHPAYNFYVVKLLESFTEDLGGIDNIDPLVARELLEKNIIPVLEKNLERILEIDISVNTFFKDLLREINWIDDYKDYASSPTFYSYIHGTNELINEANIFLKPRK